VFCFFNKLDQWLTAHTSDFTNRHCFPWWC